MKCRQVCPECHYEVLLDDFDMAVSKCPNCNGTRIAQQTLVHINDNPKGIFLSSEMEENELFDGDIYNGRIKDASTLAEYFAKKSEIISVGYDYHLLHVLIHQQTCLYGLRSDVLSV